MSRSVSLADLQGMSSADRERVLGDLVDRALEPSNGRRSAIAARVREYEEHYDMTSDELRAKLADGRLSETREFSQWMFWYNALRQHG